MNVKFKNIDLIKTRDFLHGIPLKGVASRARTKLITELDTNIKTFSENEVALAKEYAIVDEEGNFLVTNSEGELVPSQNNSFQLKPEVTDEYRDERETLFNEKVSIILLDNHVEKLLDSMNSLDTDLKGEDAIVYDLLCDALESAVPTP